MLDLAHQKEIPRVAVLAQKRLGRLEQDRVSGPEHDVADLSSDALTVSRYRNDGCPITRPKTSFPHASIHDRTGIRDNRLHETAFGSGGVKLKYLVCGGHKAPNFLKVNDRFDDTHKDQPVSSLETRFRTNGAHDFAVPLDFDQVHAGKVA